jgi:protein TonB
MKIIVLIAAILSSFTIHGQENNDEYIPFMENGVEFKTNGIDTICIVDPMPEYPGGRKNMIQFIHTNLKYPKSAKKDNVEGTVILNIKVEKNGKIENIKVIQSVRDDLDAEAIRLIRKMPKWKPGEQHGKPIIVSFNFPIRFKL